MKKYLTLTNHPAHERALLALTEAVEACREFTEDHRDCDDEDCGCHTAAGIVTALEMFRAFLEGVAFPAPHRRDAYPAPVRKVSHRKAPYDATLCCITR